MNKSDIFSVMGLLIGFIIVGLIGIYIGGELITITNVTGSWAGESSTSIVETFEIGVLLCKIVVIVSVATIIMKKLFSSGIISKFDEEDQGGM